MMSGIVRGGNYRYFHCPHAMVQVGEGGYTKECIREEALNAAVLDSVKGLLLAADETKNLKKLFSPFLFSSMFVMIE
ncbi:MAG: hypothetical protein K1W28_11255 [Lachnospiraceae bacterium]